MLNLSLLESAVISTKRLQLINARGYIGHSQMNKTTLIKAAAELLTPDVTATLPHNFQGVTDLKTADEWLTQMLATSELLLALLPEQNKIIGFIFLAKIDEKSEFAAMHLGYLLGKPYWRKGYANEALEGLLHWSRNYLSKTLFIAGVDNSNASSLKLLKNKGFIERSVQPVIDVTFFQLSL